MAENRYIICPKYADATFGLHSRPCEYEQWVGDDTESVDMAFGELWAHVFVVHANYDTDKTAQIMSDAVMTTMEF